MEPRLANQTEFPPLRVDEPGFIPDVELVFKAQLDAERQLWIQRKMWVQKETEGDDAVPPEIFDQRDTFWNQTSLTPPAKNAPNRLGGVQLLTPNEPVINSPQFTPEFIPCQFKVPISQERLRSAIRRGFEGNPFGALFASAFVLGHVEPGDSQTMTVQIFRARESAIGTKTTPAVGWNQRDPENGLVVIYDNPLLTRLVVVARLCVIYRMHRLASQFVPDFDGDDNARMEALDDAFGRLFKMLDNTQSNPFFPIYQVLPARMIERLFETPPTTTVVHSTAFMLLRGRETNLARDVIMQFAERVVRLPWFLNIKRVLKTMLKSVDCWSHADTVRCKVHQAEWILQPLFFNRERAFVEEIVTEQPRDLSRILTGFCLSKSKETDRMYETIHAGLARMYGFEAQTKKFYMPMAVYAWFYPHLVDMGQVDQRVKSLHERTLERMTSSRNPQRCKPEAEEKKDELMTMGNHAFSCNFEERSCMLKLFNNRKNSFPELARMVGEYLHPPELVGMFVKYTTYPRDHRLCRLFGIDPADKKRMDECFGPTQNGDSIETPRLGGLDSSSDRSHPLTAGAKRKRALMQTTESGPSSSFAVPKRPLLLPRRNLRFGTRKFFAEMKRLSGKRKRGGAEEKTKEMQSQTLADASTGSHASSSPGHQSDDGSDVESTYDVDEHGPSLSQLSNASWFPQTGAFVSSQTSFGDLSLVDDPAGALVSLSQSSAMSFGNWDPRDTNYPPNSQSSVEGLAFSQTSFGFSAME